MLSENKELEWLNHSPSYRHCPNCEHGVLETRIKRGFFVKYFFIWMDVKRYQCNACGKKVYIKNSAENHQLNF